MKTLIAKFCKACKPSREKVAAGDKFKCPCCGKEWERGNPAASVSEGE